MTQIINFPPPRHRGRGRPKLNRPSTDTGTPELIMKRLRGETSEALDTCLQRGLITSEQHWCGIHLRWLYTIKYAAPTIRSIESKNVERSPINNDPAWKEAREQEWNQAATELAKNGYANVLYSLCVYNEPPSFLSRNGTFSDAEALRITRIRDGLDLLENLWRKKK